MYFQLTNVNAMSTYSINRLLNVLIKPRSNEFQILPSFLPFPKMPLQDHLTLMWMLAQWSIACLQCCPLYLNSPSTGPKSIQNFLVTHPV